MYSDKLRKMMQQRDEETEAMPLVAPSLQEDRLGDPAVQHDYDEPKRTRIFGVVEPVEEEKKREDENIFQKILEMLGY